MRTHGYPNFPDPTTNPPPPGFRVFIFNEYWALGPGTGTEIHSPAFMHAANACGVNPLAHR
jgi:hypothetical protein